MLLVHSDSCTVSADADVNECLVQKEHALGKQRDSHSVRQSL